MLYFIYFLPFMVNKDYQYKQSRIWGAELNMNSSQAQNFAVFLWCQPYAIVDDLSTWSWSTPWAIKKRATDIFTITSANVDRFQ